MELTRTCEQILIDLSGMEGYQIWLYVIIAIIYVISKAMKKSRQKQGQAPPPPRDIDHNTGEPSGSPPPMSFEELLREITEGKKKQRQPAPAPPRPKQVKIPPFEKPKPAFVDYDDDIEPEVAPRERVNYDEEHQATTRQVYERAQREASLKSSLEALHSDIKGRKSTLTTLESSLSGLRSEKFESSRMGDKHSLIAEYLRELRTPEGMKRAVVLSEILKPKF